MIGNHGVDTKVWEDFRQKRGSKDVNSETGRASYTRKRHNVLPGSPVLEYLVLPSVPADVGAKAGVLRDSLLPSASVTL